MTREALLKTAIRDYEDKQNPAKLVPYKRFVDQSGYSYIIKRKNKARDIFCAIHFDTEWIQDDFLGNLRSVSVEVSTRDKLDTECLIEYQDLTIFLKSYSGYNETMKQYMYIGNCLSADQLILLEKPTKLYGNTCYDKLLEWKEYEIVPKYLSKSDWKDKKVICDIEDSQSMSLVDYDNVENLSQMRNDIVKFTFVNFSREEIMIFQHKLMEFSINYNLIGFLENPKLKDETKLNSNALTKTLLTVLEAQLCYNLEINKKLDSKFIRTVMYKLREVDQDKGE